MQTSSPRQPEDSGTVYSDGLCQEVQLSAGHCIENYPTRITTNIDHGNINDSEYLFHIGIYSSAIVPFLGNYNVLLS